MRNQQKDEIMEGRVDEYGMDPITKITYDYLLKKYKRVIIGKKELIHEMNISMQTLDIRIKKKINIPDFHKDDSLIDAKNTQVTFHIYDVAVYLSGRDKKVKTI